MYKVILAIVLCPTISYGVRGPQKHLKRLACPRHWMLDKMSGIFAKSWFVIKNVQDEEGNTYNILVNEKPFKITLIKHIDATYYQEIDDTMLNKEEQS